MPIYTYKCEACNFIFEELVSYDKKDDVNCNLCKGKAHRGAAETFGINTTLNPKTDTIYSPKEIDKVVGAESEKKWAGYDERWRQRYEARQQKRWKGMTPTPVNIPKDPDGKYTPIMHLGNSKDRELRREYSTALQEHRAERKKRGEDQFDAPGAIL
jgi:putative FmdB family regulatory protein